MVPEATFTSYYGRPVVKPSPWENDIPAYLFLGGLAAGSSLLGAGADLTGRPALRTHRPARRAGRHLAVDAWPWCTTSGKPSRFVNMLRVAKPTSPMSVGTWILTAYGPLAGCGGDRRAGRSRRGSAGAVAPAGPAARSVGPPGRAGRRPRRTGGRVVHRGAAGRHRHAVLARGLPRAAVRLRRLGGRRLRAASGMIGSPVREAGPARRLAVGGALLELAAEHQMEQCMGLTAEPLHQGRAGTLMRASKTLTVAGAVGAALLGGRSRIAAALSGAALLAGSACTRFGVFEAGQASARDPRYTVVPQRERLERRQAEQAELAQQAELAEQAGQPG